MHEIQAHRTTPAETAATCSWTGRARAATPGRQKTPAARRGRHSRRGRASAGLTALRSPLGTPQARCILLAQAQFSVRCKHSSGDGGEQEAFDLVRDGAPETTCIEGGQAGQRADTLWQRPQRRALRHLQVRQALQGAHGVRQPLQARAPGHIKLAQARELSDRVRQRDDAPAPCAALAAAGERCLQSACDQHELRYLTRHNTREASAPARQRLCRDVTKPMVSGRARRSCRLVKSRTIVSSAASACALIWPGGRGTMLSGVESDHRENVAILKVDKAVTVASADSVRQGDSLLVCDNSHPRHFSKCRDVARRRKQWWVGETGRSCRTPGKSHFPSIAHSQHGDYLRVKARRGEPHKCIPSAARLPPSRRCNSHITSYRSAGGRLHDPPTHEQARSGCNLQGGEQGYIRTVRLPFAGPVPADLCRCFCCASRTVVHDCSRRDDDDAPVGNQPLPLCVSGHRPSAPTLRTWAWTRPAAAAWPSAPDTRACWWTAGTTPHRQTPSSCQRWAGAASPRDSARGLMLHDVSAAWHGMRLCLSAAPYVIDKAASGWRQGGCGRYFAGQCSAALADPADFCLFADVDNQRTGGSVGCQRQHSTSAGIAEDAERGWALQKLPTSCGCACFTTRIHGYLLTPRLWCADQDGSAGKAPDDAVYSTLREIEDAGHKVRTQLDSRVQSSDATVVNYEPGEHPGTSAPQSATLLPAGCRLREGRCKRCDEEGAPSALTPSSPCEPYSFALHFASPVRKLECMSLAAASDALTGPYSTFRCALTPMYWPSSVSACSCLVAARAPGRVRPRTSASASWRRGCQAGSPRWTRRRPCRTPPRRREPPARCAKCNTRPRSVAIHACRAPAARLVCIRQMRRGATQFAATANGYSSQALSLPACVLFPNGLLPVIS